MKKLLAMLTTITSLSSITPIILANASAAEVPQNKIVNNEIDYLQTNNLENLSRVKRNNNNFNIENNVYYFNSENSYDKQDLPYPVTTMYTFTSVGGNRKAGDIYFGTTNGVYLRQAGNTTATKIDGINDPVTLIQSYTNNGQAHAISSKGDVYFIDEYSIVRKQSVPYPITTMYTFTKDGNNRKTGDIYFGTTNGVYLRQAGNTTATKIDGINDPVTLIQPYTNNGQAHAISSKGDVYFIDENSVANKQNDVSDPVTTMYTFTKDGNNRKTGDIYFGTTNGVYLRKAGAITATKIDGINDGTISIIQPHHNMNNSVHVISLKILYKNSSTNLHRRDNVKVDVNEEIRQERSQQWWNNSNTTQAREAEREWVYNKLNDLANKLGLKINQQKIDQILQEKWNKRQKRFGEQCIDYWAAGTTAGILLGSGGGVPGIIVGGIVGSILGYIKYTQCAAIRGLFGVRD